MAKRKSIKQEIAALKAKATRETKRAMFDEVCKKDKVETLKDMVSVFYGLSRNAIELSAYREIQMYMRCGCSPVEIIKRMEGKNDGKTHFVQF
jgi:hypothetical protein